MPEISISLLRDESSRYRAEERSIYCALLNCLLQLLRTVLELAVLTQKTILYLLAGYCNSSRCEMAGSHLIVPLAVLIILTSSLSCKGWCVIIL
jgi:hypothetical protein